ncbi:uncharacterized protein LOC21387793 isoform X2 [Morus notabilis]|uniref:uncharacterized protein LOC21387793 isoform X2 n=1 Tax=Morus notabilis TaxID=981085 RepID=UPI000CED6754|nr:uncharacterized protein LOC21387793 isoform X2 [Morus notabilis]
MWWLILFGLGIAVGAVAILGAEAFLLFVVVKRLSRKTEQSDRKIEHLDHNQSLDYSHNKQGVVWVLESNKVPKDWLDKAPKEQKRKKEFFEVSPVRKHARIKDQSLILTDSNGSKTTMKLKGCSIEAVSASMLSSRKWAKRFPIKLENKVSAIYKDSKTVYIYLETSWEKESWCKALRLASCDDKSRLDWFLNLQKEFSSYLTALNARYPTFMKPSAGFHASELVDRAQKVDGPSSKVRTLWKKFAKKASKGGAENKLSWIPSLAHVERTISEKFNPYQDSAQGTSFLKNSLPIDVVKHSTEDNLVTSSLPTLIHSTSQSQISSISAADTDERFGIDEGTLCKNLLISRLFFDAKRNAGMKRSLQARIQRTLSNMRTPSYIGEVICTDVDLGNIPPYIHGIRVLPMDTNEVWAFEVDIEYSGGAVLGIETRLEVRELDPEKSIVGPNSESNSVGDVSSELLEGFEYFGKQLNLAEGTIEEPEHKEEDTLKGSKSAVSASTYPSRWKAIVNSIAKQVSQVPISLAIRVASLRGTIRLHIKPPPSDQLWFGFTSMPDIDFNLDSAVGDHKITNGHIALALVNRLKGAIFETLVLPNSESVCIPWMLAEQDDWVPRKVAPFIWLNQESANDPATSSGQVISNPPCEGKPKTDVNRGTSNANSQSNNRNSKNAERIQPISESLDNLPRSASSACPSDKTLQELRTPLLGNDEHGTEKDKGGEIPESESASRSLSFPDRQNQAIEEDDSRPKKIGTRARMLDLGKKMGEKFEEKRRHIEEKSKQIVEKMRGSETAR